jgi:hypothetical protein
MTNKVIPDKEDTVPLALAIACLRHSLCLRKSVCRAYGRLTPTALKKIQAFGKV